MVEEQQVKSRSQRHQATEQIIPCPENLVIGEQGLRKGSADGSQAARRYTVGREGLMRECLPKAGSQSPQEARVGTHQGQKRHGA